MSFYVERATPDGRTSWTGPIRSADQVEREAEAWRSAGWTAVVRPATDEVRSIVRKWQKAKSARVGTRLAR